MSVSESERRAVDAYQHMVQLRNGAVDGPIWECIAIGRRPLLVQQAGEVGQEPVHLLESTVHDGDMQNVLSGVGPMAGGWGFEGSGRDSSFALCTTIISILIWEKPIFFKFPSSFGAFLVWCVVSPLRLFS